MERKFVGQALGLAVVACAVLGGVGAASANIVIDTVPVGDPGNAGQLSGTGAGSMGPDRVCGAVDYTYNIGKYEVTAGQYAAFLTAVAATDTHSLYNPIMANTTYGSGISRSGSAGSYSYIADPAYVNRPVSFVSFWSACRFTNWLNNGQGGAETTETGAYDLTNPDAITNNTVTRSPGATWAVTSEDEWYKAAYYNPASGTYYLYPTRSNTAPGNDMADALGNNANYYTGLGSYPIDAGKYTTVAGEFQNSASPYGTFDQGGNVWEWTETIVYGDSRVQRGGAWGNGSDNVLAAAYRNANYYPRSTSTTLGFRVVQLVPEPATLGVLGVAVVGMLVRRRGLRK